MSEANRIVFLFELYEKFTAGLYRKLKKIKNPKHKHHKNQADEFISYHINDCDGYKEFID